MSKLERLKAENRALRTDLGFLKEVIKNQEKTINAHKKAWRRVHPEDQAFMREFQQVNEDPALFDVFNGLLYSFGRAGKNNRVFTRLDSWNK